MRREVCKSLLQNRICCMKEVCCVIGFYKVVHKLLEFKKNTAGRKFCDAAVYRESFATVLMPRPMSDICQFPPRH